ncbi:MAG TPA: PEP-CTERM sorting domain-containing protein [Terriglobales bacterium]|jgi:hypothetical protein|nr:PEP-CTERM sorting domain-containing protein [Terriglobales bacterium]
MPRKPANLSRSTNHQLNMYAVAATAAGVSALALPQPSEAKVVYTPAHVKLAFDQPFGLDLNHDGIVDLYLFHYYPHYSSGENSLLVCHNIRQYSINRSFCSTSKNWNPQNAVLVTKSNFKTYGAALRPGAKIQRGDRFLGARSVSLGHGETTSMHYTGHYLWYGPWMNGGKGVRDRYLGIRFAINGRLHFGWARMTVKPGGNVNGNPTFTATLTGYAYETIPGKAIVAGQTKSSDGVVERPGAALTTPTPEPATLGMLALGAQGVVWRRKEPALSPLSP